MEVLEKVGIIIKNKFNCELTFVKKYLKAEKMHTKGHFQFLYAPVILFDSIYSKDGRYFRKVLFYWRQKFVLVILVKNIMMKNV